MKLLFENWRKYNTAPFELMCEQHQKALISDQELFSQWEAMALLELKKLEEINWEKEAERTADPNYKPPHEREGLLAKGWEKVNDWVLEKSIQLVELAKRNALMALKSINWLVGKLDDFCDQFPTICKIAKWTLIVAAFYIAFAFLIENEAQAKLYRSGKPLDGTIVDGMKGQLVDIIDSRKEKGANSSELYKLLAQIDEIHDSNTPHDFMKKTEQVDKGLRVLYKGLKETWNQTGSAEELTSRQGKELVSRWIDIGERTTAWYKEETIKIKGFMSKTLDYGKTLAKKGN